jgi:GNAT superfamily N-acetyltransferase
VARRAQIALRVAVPADAPAMARTMSIGFETYRAFAPPGWRPPPDDTPWIRNRMSTTAGAWALLAEVAGEPAGHVSLVPLPGDEVRTAYLWHLFVRPPHWGSGLAGVLHDAFLDRAREAGHARAQLRTPAAHGRARRFYARRGWRVDGPPERDTPFGMPIVTMDLGL